MICLILAAGDSDRWKGRIPKQLIQIRNEPLISGTIRQIRHKRHYIITHNQEIIGALNGSEHFEPKQQRWITETLLSTKSLWGERTLVLLGDVIYSDEAIDLMLNCTKPLSVFGCKWEIFGLSFSGQNINEVRTSLSVAIEHAEQGGRGKLWEFYRTYCGIPLSNTQTLEKEVFVPIDDRTNDIDSIEEYFLHLQACPSLGRRSMRNIIREIGR